MSNKTLRTADLKELVKTTVTCGDCRGLSRDVLIPAATKPCESLGKLEDSKMCKHFRTNTYDLQNLMQEGGDGLVALFQLFGSMEEKDLRIISMMLLREANTRKHGVKMGQPVFVRYRGRESRNYMNNFMAARVLDIDDKEIRLISEEGNIVLTYPNTGLAGPSVYSKSEFKPLMRKMKAEDKLIDPEQEIKTVKKYLPDEDVKFKVPTILDGFSVPNMDDVVKGKKGKKGKKTNTLVDLIDLMGKIDSGSLLGAFADDEDGALELGEDVYEMDDEDRKPKAKAKSKSKSKVKAKTKLRKRIKGPVEMGDM